MAKDSIATDEELIDRTLGHYRVVRKLGSGGMGEVYLAYDTVLGRSVALKVLPSTSSISRERVQRFVGEARAASVLNHPNIATIHELGEADDLRFIVMQYVVGETLSARLAGGPLRPPDIVSIGGQIADALEAAHGGGIIHRDIKPSNVIITPRGHAVVLDFGIAKRVSYPEPTSEDSTVEPTHTGVVMGTVQYMSPEQALGRPVDFRSDIFSLGVVLYEMATGRLPFSGSTHYETIDAIIHRAPKSIVRLNPAIPVALEGVINRCMEKAPEDRFQTAAELARELRNPVASADSDRGDVFTRRLPQQLTRFIGRRREIAEVRIALSEARLVTLSGPGGIGKTRLALQVAADSIREYADGVWFVDLAPLSDQDLVPQTLASALGVREERGRAMTDTLTVHLSPKRLLLVLDNCEHLIGGCARLADTLLRACPHLRILATSRESLSITGEEILRVPSLSLPEVDRSPLPASIADHEAVQLFVDRARLVKSTFELTGSNAVAVAKVCLMLEGIPLAIELAASHVKVLSVQQIAARLDDRFGLLTGGSRTAIGRHQALLAAIDWSYNLLSEAERKLFRRLSVFSGGWTLEAAEAVCSSDGIARIEVLELLSGLVDKSLVLADTRHGHQRYRLMGTLLEYAQKRLRQTDERTALQQTHAEFFTEFAVEGEAHLMSSDQEIWLELLNLEYDNMRAALNWVTEHDVQLALRLAAALGRFWYFQGYWEEGRRWLADLLELEGAHLHPGRRAKALNAAARLVQHQGDHAGARSIVEQALILARECGDEHETAVALNTAAISNAEQGEFAAARVLLEESLAIRRRLGNKGEIAMTLNNLGILAGRQAEYMTARTLYDESLAIFRDVEDKHGIAMVLLNRGDLSGRMGDDAGARSLVEEGLGLARSLGDKTLIPVALNTLGVLFCRQGEHEAARVLNEEGLEIARQVGNKSLVALTLLSLGTEAEHRGAYAAARSAFEEALTVLRELDDKRKMAVALSCLGRVIARHGDYAAARLHHEESLAMSRRMGLRDGIAKSLVGLADIARLQGDHAPALALYRKSLAMLWEIGDQPELPRLFEDIAALLLLQRQPEHAVSLWGAAQAFREKTSMCRPPNERAEYEHYLERSRGELGHERFEAVWAHGRAMTLEQVVACALNEEL